MPNPTLPAEIEEAARSGAEALVAAVRRRGGTPLRDGAKVTLVYAGSAHPPRFHHWFDIFPPVPRFRRIVDTRLWWMTMEVSDQARLEYKLRVRPSGRSRLVLDPLNPRHARNPYGVNSVLTGRRYARPVWAMPSPGVAGGTLVDLPVMSAAFGEVRAVRIYVPAGGSRDGIPLLVVHDGSEYLEYAALATVLDNLISEGVVPPVAAVLTDPGERLVEYGADPRHAGHIVDEVIPAVRAEIGAPRGANLAVGASFGGVASLHAAWTRPEAFDALVLQSGSFVEATGGPFRRGEAFEPVVEMMRRLQARPGRLPRRVHLSCGRHDGLIDDNIRFAEWLRRHHVEVGWEAADDGHDWANWRDRLRGGLVFALDSDQP